MIVLILVFRLESVELHDKVIGHYLNIKHYQ
ncbi:IS1 family transposase [Escherichia coli]